MSKEYTYDIDKYTIGVDENDMFSVVRVKDVLSKYKEIIGDDK